MEVTIKLRERSSMEGAIVCTQFAFMFFVIELLMISCMCFRSAAWCSQSRLIQYRGRKSAQNSSQEKLHSAASGINAQ